MALRAAGRKGADNSVLVAHLAFWDRLLIPRLLPRLRSGHGSGQGSGQARTALTIRKLQECINMNLFRKIQAIVKATLEAGP